MKELDKSISVNAKELFYTLENVQIDCRTLDHIHIHNMVNVVDNKISLSNNSFDSVDKPMARSLGL